MDMDGRKRLRMLFEKVQRTRVQGVHNRLGKFDIEVCLNAENDADLFFNLSASTAHKKFKSKRSDVGDYLEILWPRHERDRKGKEKLHEFNFSLTYGAGIYLGGDKFPEMCCICCKPVTRYWFLERLDRVNNINEITEPKIEEEFKGKWPLIAKAIANDRYWYAIPFCDEHEFSDGYGIVNDSGDMKGFKNPEYGKQFAELNNYKTHWVSAREAKLRKRASCSFIIGLVLLVIPVTIMILESSSGDLGPLPNFAIPGAVAILVALIFRIASKLMGRKEESQY